MSYNIEGLIILSHTLPSSDLAALGVPVVTIEREDRFISSVNTDNLMGGIQAASLLYKNQFAVLVEKYYFQRYRIIGRHYCLVGYDNSNIATEAIVPFSSVGQQTDVIARETMEILIGQIKKRRKDPECRLPVEHKVVTPILERRDTSLPELY